MRARQRLRHIAPPDRADGLRPVEEELAVAERGLRILIDRNDDRLHMVKAPAFPRLPCAGPRRAP